jgi:putative PEP-CTERM system TPR-repeat lipoprotein
MNKRAHSIFLAFAVIVSPLSGCTKQTPDELVESAKTEINNKQYQKALINLKTALQTQPGKVEARILLGKTMQELGGWIESESEFDKARAMGASPETVLPLLAQTLFKLGKYKELLSLEIPKTGIGSSALASLQAERAMSYLILNQSQRASEEISLGEKILSSAGHIGPFDDIELAKAELAIFKNNTDLALHLLSDIEKRDPQRIDVKYIKATLFLREDKTDAALNELSEITNIRPTEITALLMLANTQINIQALGAAGKSISVIESMQPHNLLGKALRARLELQLGSNINLANANEAIQSVLKALPNDPMALTIAAEINERLGNLETSFKEASQVQAVNPLQIETALIMARTYLRQRDLVAAFDLLDKLSKVHSDSPLVLAYLGEVLIISGKKDSGLDYLIKAAKLAPTSSEIAIMLAKGYQSIGKTSEAMSKLETTSKLNGEQGSADELLILLALHEKDFSRALRAANSYIAKKPNNPAVQNQKAVVLMAMNNTEEAEQILENILLKKPDYFPAAANLATLDIKKYRFEKAKNRFLSILKHVPRSFDAMSSLANLALMEKNDADYIYWTKLAIKEHSTAIALRAHLIEHYLTRNEKKLALEEATETVHANPGVAAAMVILAKTQMATGETQRALTSYSQAVELAPKSSLTTMLLGLAQLSTGNLQSAQQNLLRAKELGSNNVELTIGLLQIATQQGNVPQALIYAKQVQQQAPNSAIGFDEEGALLLSLNRTSDAVTRFRKALEIQASPNRVIRLHKALKLGNSNTEAAKLIIDWTKRYQNNVNFRLYLADSLASEGHEKEAIEAYEAILATKPNDAHTLNNFALLLRHSAPSRALRYAEQALQYAPGDANTRDTLGLIVTEQGNVARGTQLFEEAVNLEPTNPTFRYHLATIYAKTGNRGKVVELLRPTIANNVSFPENHLARELYVRMGGK